MSGMFRRRDYPVRWIPVSQLSVVWAEAQRQLDEGKVRGYAENLDPNKFGIIAVSLPNGGGVHHVIDGQHRVAAVRSVWGDREEVPCLVLPAHDPATAAEIWLAINEKRSRPQAVDRFRVAVTAGHELEVAVNKLLLSLGYRVGFDAQEGTLRAVDACLRVAKRFGLDVLRSALTAIQQTWGKQPDAVHGAIIQGYAEFLAQYADQIEWERLISCMAKAYTPARLLGAAKTAREMFRGSIPSNAKRVIVNTYNHGLRGRRKIGEEER